MWDDGFLFTNGQRVHTLTHSHTHIHESPNCTTKRVQSAYVSPEIISQMEWINRQTIELCTQTICWFIDLFPLFAPYDVENKYIYPHILCEKRKNSENSRSLIIVRILIGDHWHTCGVPTQHICTLQAVITNNNNRFASTSSEINKNKCCWPAVLLFGQRVPFRVQITAKYNLLINTLSRWNQYLGRRLPCAIFLDFFFFFFFFRFCLSKTFIFIHWNWID